MIYTQDIVKQAVFCKYFDNYWLHESGDLLEGASSEAVAYAHDNLTIVDCEVFKDTLTGKHYSVYRASDEIEADADDWCFKVVEVVKTERVVVEWKEKTND